MRFVQFSMKRCLDSGPRFGVQLDNQFGDIIDITKSLNVKNTLEFLKGGSSLLGAVQREVENGQSMLKFGDVNLLAPISNPDKVLCIGMNYKDHCEEQNKPIPEEPLVFNKFPSCITGPFDPIPYPEITKELDWEVELTIVIGKKGFQIPVEKASDHIFGFTVAHDVSARDWQLTKNGGQWLLGKSMDSFCPIGPAIVTPDEIGDPHNLNLECIVNGETKQNSNTQQLVFNAYEIVAWCSKFCTLLPGDLILTGTPPGVGCFMKPPQFLKKGDIVECTVEKIGTVKNAIV